jgi:hypothetical protein
VVASCSVIVDAMTEHEHAAGQEAANQVRRGRAPAGSESYIAGPAGRFNAIRAARQVDPLWSTDVD